MITPEQFAEEMLAERATAEKVVRDAGFERSSGAGVPGAAQQLLVMRCRPGPVTHSVFGTAPALRRVVARCTASGARCCRVVAYATSTRISASRSGMSTITSCPHGTE